MKFKFQFFSPFKLLAFLFLLTFFTACQDEEAPVLLQNFSKGILVVNEGPFGGTGTITWHNPNTGETVQDLFGKANNGAALGQFVQSYTIHNKKGYVVVNGANKIVVVNAETFQYIDTIGGLFLPRYFLPVDDNFAYVSQWGPDGKTGSVAKVNLNTLKVVKTIPTGSGAEKMSFSVDKSAVWVANAGGFGVDSAVTFIPISTEQPQRFVISGQRNPCCVAILPIASGLSDFKALCQGDWAVPASNGWIGDPIAKQGLTVQKGATDLCFSITEKQFFYTDGTAVYAHSGSLVQKRFEQKIYGFNCNPDNGIFYCADPKDFNANGEVFIRRTDGTVISSFTCGIAPGEIVFY